MYAGEGGNYNIVNNYYKSGPSTSKASRYRVINPFKREDIPFGKFYVSGNYVEGSEEVTKDNWQGVVMDKGTGEDVAKAKLDKPFGAVEIETQIAQQAYDLVLEKVGASYRRDTLDERILRDVQNKTGKFIDVQGGYPHGTPYEQTVNAWPL